MTPHEAQASLPLTSPGDAGTVPVPQPPSVKRESVELPALGSVGAVVSIQADNGAEPMVPSVQEKACSSTPADTPRPPSITAVVCVTIPPGKMDRLNLDQRYLRELPCLQLPPPEPPRVGGTLANAMAASAAAASYNPHLVSQAVSHVKLLNLQNNELESLVAPALQAAPPYSSAPTPLSCFGSVVYLDLYNNRLTSLQGADQLKKLRVLMVGKNRLSNLSLLYEQVTPTALEVLDVHGNCLTTFFLSAEDAAASGGVAPVAAKVFPQLRVLNVAGNRLNNLCGMECLPALSEFNARRNRISDLPDSMPRHALNLRKCFLSSNQLGARGWEEARHIVRTIASCKNLEEVTLDANPMKPTNVVPNDPKGGQPTSPLCGTDAKPLEFQDDNLRLALVSALPSLRLLDSSPISDDDRVRAATHSLAAQEEDPEVSMVTSMGAEGSLVIEGPTSAHSTPTDAAPSESITSPVPPTSPSCVSQGGATASQSHSIPFALRPSPFGSRAGRNPSFSKQPAQRTEVPASNVNAFTQFNHAGGVWSIDVGGLLSSSTARRLVLPPCPNSATCGQVVLNHATSEFLRHPELPAALQQLASTCGGVVQSAQPLAPTAVILDLNVVTEASSVVNVWDLLHWLRLLARPPKAFIAGALTVDGEPVPKEWSIVLKSSLSIQLTPSDQDSAVGTRLQHVDDRWMFGGSAGRSGNGAVGGGCSHLWAAWKTTRSKPCLHLSAAFGKDVVAAAALVGESMRALDAALVNTTVLTKVLQLCGAETSGGTRGGSPSAGTSTKGGRDDVGGQRRVRRIAREVNPVHQPKPVVVHVPGAGSLFLGDCVRDDVGSRARTHRGAGGPARRVHRAVAHAGKLHPHHAAAPKRATRHHSTASQALPSTPTSVSSSIPPRPEELEADVENPDEEEEEEEEEE